MFQPVYGWTVTPPTSILDSATKQVPLLVSILCFEGHLHRLGEIICTHNLECSTVVCFLVVLEASFQPVACLVIFTMDDDSTILEWKLKDLGHMTHKIDRVHSPQISICTWSKSSLDNLSAGKVSLMIVILTACSKENWRSAIWCFLGKTVILEVGVETSDLNFLVPPSLSLVADSAYFCSWSTFFFNCLCLLHLCEGCSKPQLLCIASCCLHRHIHPW